jgi:hypothetical protein
VVLPPAEKLYSIFFCGIEPHFVFPATGASEKLLTSENRIKGGFQGDVGGIGGSGVQSENPNIFGERHSRQEKFYHPLFLLLFDKSVFLVYTIFVIISFLECKVFV